MSSFKPGAAFQRRRAAIRGTATAGGRALRLAAGVMNQSEQRYALDVLEPKRKEGAILWWGFQSHRLRLAKDAHYTPDFAVLHADAARTYELIDFKGYQEEAALVRVKVAASLYWWWLHSIAWRRRVKDGGGYGARVVDPWPLDGPAQLAERVSDYVVEGDRVSWRAE